MNGNNIVHLKPDCRDEWNALAAKEPGFSLLQSWEWGDFKEKLGWKAFRIGLVEDNRLMAGAQLLIRPLLGGLLSIAYLPRGPIGCWREEASASRLFREIHEVDRAHHAAFLKVEPPLLHDPTFEAFMLKSGFRISRFSIQPRATIILDLRPDLNTILKGMRQKTRQYIRGAAREGITVRHGGRDDIGILAELIRRAGRHMGIPFRNRDYFLQQWQILGTKGMMAPLMASRQGQLLAVRTVMRFGSHAAEFHAASVPDADGSHANYLLVWEAIQWAKTHGCSTYDFWGVPDEVGRLSWEGREADAAGRKGDLWGVYHFKKGFSRSVVYYSASYDYVYSRALYRLMLRWGSGNEFLERLASLTDRFHRRDPSADVPSGPGKDEAEVERRRLS